MSLLSIGLLVAFIAVLIWMKVDEKRKWETVFETTGNRSHEVQARYNFLRKNGVRCRMKNYNPAGIKVMASQMSKMLTMQLQVNRKDMEKAKRLLSDYRKEAPNPTN